MKILAAVPIEKNNKGLDLEVIYRMTHQSGLPDGVDLDWIFVKGHDIGIERNALVRDAKGKGADKIWFVDSDVMVPEDALKNMLDPDVDVCMGFVPIRNTKRRASCIHKKAPYFDPKMRITYGEEIDSLPDRVEVKGGGFACVLMNLSVFDKVETPWFMYKENKNGVRTGEDISFCYKLEAEGIPVFADTRVRCGHQRSDYDYG